MVKKRVMIVDDNPDLLFLVKKGLENENDEFDVIGAESGKKCFELLENNELPDIILLDIMMPEMNGWDVFSYIKQKPEWKDIPIVFLTAKSDEFSKGFGKLSAADYITKPFEISYLMERIELLLKR